MHLAAILSPTTDLSPLSSLPSLLNSHLRPSNKVDGHRSENSSTSSSGMKVFEVIMLIILYLVHVLKAQLGQSSGLSPVYSHTGLLCPCHCLRMYVDS